MSKALREEPSNEGFTQEVIDPCGKKQHKGDTGKEQEEINC